MRGRLVTNEYACKLGAGNLIRQAGGNECTGTYTDVNIHVLEIDAVQRFVQRDKRADFVDTTQQPTACQRQADSAVAGPAAFQRY